MDYHLTLHDTFERNDESVLTFSQLQRSQIILIKGLDAIHVLENVFREAETFFLVTTSGPVSYESATLELAELAGQTVISVSHGCRLFWDGELAIGFLLHDGSTVQSAPVSELIGSFAADKGAIELTLLRSLSFPGVEKELAAWNSVLKAAN